MSSNRGVLVMAVLVTCLAGCSSAGASTDQGGPAGAGDVSSAAPETPQPKFPLGPTVLPSIGDNIVGGNMCVPEHAYWTSEAGHPAVQVLWPGVLEVSVDFVDKSNNVLGTSSGQIDEGRTGIHLVASDVKAADVAAAELAVAGSASGSCVVPKL